MPNRSRKRQSRLAFTPLPSSSPAAKGYHQQIQDRAAAVTYQGSSNPAKRRKMANGTDDNEQAAFMPTPATSLPQPVVDELDDDDEQPVRSTQKRRKRARQQRLDFEPSDGAVNLASPTGPSMFGNRRQQATQDVSSDESEGLPSPGKLIKAKSNHKSKKDNGFMEAKPKRVTRSTQKTPEPEAEHEEEEEDDDDDDDIVVRHGRKSSPVQAINEEEDSKEDSEDEMPTTAATQKRRRKQRESSFISSSPPAAVESDDEVQIIEKPKRKRHHNSGSEDEDNDEELAPRTPGRRKLKARRNLTQQEQEDLDDDLEFLGPSSDIEESRAPRSTQSKAKDARNKALEKLKQQRSSQRGMTQIVEDDEGDDGNDEGDTQEYYEMYDKSDDEAAPPPTSSRAMFNADEDDEDFLAEDDEDGLLGVPDGIPLAFTRYASMKAKELFKFAVDWMVQKKINPAFNMHDEIYDLTFKKLDDEVSGLVGSKFASAAWTPEFTMAVRARPEIAYNRFSAKQAGDDFFHDKCDACNRSGHPATYEVQFQGKPYHRETLDEVATNDDDEDEDDDGSSSSSSNDDNKPAYDAQGREIAPASKIYFVGKFCMSNAKTAHALQHWRYHLNEWVVEWVDKHGYSTAKKLEKREKNRKKPKKLRKEANGILDRMVEEGVVKMLWHQFRDTIDEAAHAKQGRYGGESP